MEKRRIFIAINLPESIKEELIAFQERFQELPARWVKKENLHITLAFLGYIKEEKLSQIIEMAKKVALRHDPFSINLIKVCYAPPKVSLPRMVWAVGEKSKELERLQEDVKNSLISLGIPQLEKEVERNFIPHITLARIRKWEFRQMEIDERPEINEEINLKFEVKSIEVMESHLKKTGAEYEVLKSFSLKQ